MEQVWHDIIETATGVCEPGQIDLLSRYRDWLATEARSNGGIGPAEVERLDRRHIADSLLFLRGLDRAVDVLDVGTGVGLPGIPLAIARPDIGFRLLDRSGRRVTLAKRALRVLALENVEVIQGDFATWRHEESAVVARASLSPQRMRPILDRVLTPDGVAILGGSWSQTPAEPGYETKEVGAEILDQPIWILMMRRK